MIARISPVEICQFRKPSLIAEFLQIVSVTDIKKNESCRVQVQLFSAKEINVSGSVTNPEYTPEGEQPEFISGEPKLEKIIDLPIYGELFLYDNPDYSDWLDDIELLRWGAGKFNATIIE